MNIKDLARSKGVQKAAANFSWLMVMQFIDKLVPLVMIPYLIATIGFDKWGVIGFAQSFGMYFLIIMDYGFTQTALRDISQAHEDPVRRNRIFCEVAGTKFLLGIVSSILAVAIALAVPAFRPNLVLFIAAVTLYFGQSMFPVWFFQGMENMKVSTLLSSLSRLTFLGLIFIFVKSPGDQALVLWLQAAGAWIAALTGILLAIFKYGVVLSLPSPRDIFDQIRRGAPIFFSNLSISLYTTTRGFMVGLVGTETVMGFYYLAEKLVAFLGIPFGMTAQTLYPRLSRLWQDKREAFNSLYRKLTLGTFAYVALLIPAGILLAPFLLNLLSHGKLDPMSISFFNILIFTLPFIHGNTFRLQRLLASQQNRTYMRIHVLGGVAGMALIVGLSLGFGPFGIASGAVAAEAVVFTLALGSSLLAGKRKD